MTWRGLSLLLALLLLTSPLADGGATGPAEAGVADEAAGAEPAEPQAGGAERADWWQRWRGDANRNGLDDRLDAALARGDAGEVPIYLVYDHLPDDAEVAAAEALVTVDYRARHIELLIVHHAPLALVEALLELPGVVQVRQQDQMVPALDVSVRAVKARPSNEYRDQDAWGLGYDGSGINVAVLDTGVDDEHETLQGKFVAGYDATDENPLKDDSGQTNPDDEEGHGTHVASTVMGDPPGGEYMGVAPGAGLIDVKVLTDSGASSSGYTTEGIDWTIEHKDEFDIRVLSMSFGSFTGDDDGTSAEAETVNRAVEAGLIAVVAAGNSGNQGIPSPASADLAITVAWSEDRESITRGDDTISGSSNYGPRADDGDDDHLDELKPEIAAPGQDIMAACAIGLTTGCAQNDQYVEKSGTSMATPHIAGVIALMLEANESATPQQVEAALLFAAEHRGEPYDASLSRDYDVHWGWGLVDAFRAVQAVLGGIVAVEIESPHNNATVAGRVEFSGTANGNSLERVEVDIAGLVREAVGTESWSLAWNSRELDNGTYRVIVTAYAANNLSASAEISLTVANAPAPPDAEGETIRERLEGKLDDLKENAPAVGAVAGGVVVLALAVVGVRRWLRGREEWEW